MMKLLLLCLTLFTFTACAPKSPNSRKLEVSLGSVVTENDLDGGVIFSYKNLGTGVVTTVTLTSAPFIVSIPDGAFDFHLVGFDAPVASPLWTGAVHCWSSLGQTLGSETDIYLKTPVDCATDPLAGLVSLKSTRFDIAKWDQASWAP